MIDWSRITKEDAIAISKIVAIVADGDPTCDVMSLDMDLTACHTHGCPLDLDHMAQASRADLMHDIAGIHRHLDRTTGQLQDCFVPRFAKQEA